LITNQPIKLGQQRLTSILGVKFRAAPKYFLKGVIHIKCEAKLFDRKWDSLTNITNQNYQQSPFQTAGQNRYSSGNDGKVITAFISIFSFLELGSYLNSPTTSPFFLSLFASFFTCNFPFPICILLGSFHTIIHSHQ
jgi:hypothetical protein